jgi:DNA-binding transcriptional ArsR family regulator
MTFRNEPQITDPRVLRALAHPVRTAILSRLYVGPATATECSETVGESPSACSYHLRKLASLGFVEEEASSDGRERRWKVKVTGYTYELGDTPGQRAAAATLRRHLLDVSAQRLNEYLVTEGSYDAEWVEAATIMTSSMYMTVDELKDLYARIRELLDPYIERVDPSQRPPQTTRVAFHMYAVPWPQDIALEPGETDDKPRDG